MNAKSLLKSALVIVGVMAVVYRVPQARQLVTGQ